MQGIVRDALDQVQVLEPVEAEGLQVFPLVTPRAPDGLDYLTLDDALRDGVIEVTEISEGGSVPTLKVKTRGDRRVFLMAGEQIAGAKQNRVLNASLLAESSGETLVPVSCVEQGRWSYQSKRFSSTGSATHSHLRRKMSKAAYEGYKCRGTPTSQQGEVWDEVDRKLRKAGSRSASSALEQAYADHGAELDGFVERLALPSCANGAVFAIGGRIAGADLFDRPATLAKLLPKLIKSYAIDALEDQTPTRTSADAVHTWLRSGTSAASEPFASPGVGTDVRLESPGVIGAALVVEEQLVHLEVYPQEAVDARAVILLPHTRVAGTAASLAIEVLQEGFAGAGLRLSLARELAPSVPAEDALTAENEAYLVREAVRAGPTSGVRIVITQQELADRWFSHWHAPQRTAVVSVHGWADLSEIPVPVFIAYEAVLHGLRAASSSYDPAKLLHKATRGCLFDLCRERREIEKKLTGGTICAACRQGLEAAQVSPNLAASLLTHVQQMGV